MLEEKVIELSKVKIVLLVIGALAFVGGGAWFLSLDAEFIKSQGMLRSPTLIYGLGVVSIAFFGLCGLVGIRKLLDRSPGLIVNSEGLVDNSSGVSAGFIPWSEVVGIEEFEVQKQKLIYLQVSNPNKYVNNGNVLQRMANRANTKLYGTPVQISSNSLKISYDDLLKTINEYYSHSIKNS